MDWKTKNLSAPSGLQLKFRFEYACFPINEATNIELAKAAEKQ